MFSFFRSVLTFLMACTFCATVSKADTKVLQLGSGDNGRALLLTPDRQKPKGGIVLLAGGDGVLDISPDGEIRSLRGNQLIRTREDYVRAGYAVVVPDVKANTGAAVAALRQIVRPVAIVATSRGTVRAAQAIADGVNPDSLVLTSGVLGANRKWPSVPQIVGSPSRLPPTLIIHHRQDTCFVTLPSEVEPFLAWAGGRAKVVWVVGGTNDGDACQAKGFHGFAGRDHEVVSAVTRFVTSKR